MEDNTVIFATIANSYIYQVVNHICTEWDFIYHDSHNNLFGIYTKVLYSDLIIFDEIGKIVKLKIEYVGDKCIRNLNFPDVS